MSGVDVFIRLRPRSDVSYLIANALLIVLLVVSVRALALSLLAVWRRSWRRALLGALPFLALLGATAWSDDRAQIPTPIHSTNAITSTDKIDDRAQLPEPTRASQVGTPAEKTDDILGDLESWLMPRHLRAAFALAERVGDAPVTVPLVARRLDAASARQASDPPWRSPGPSCQRSLLPFGSSFNGRWDLAVGAH